ncbi:hypothetical protein QVD17_18807 [Tagetes erecta]|uniref:Vacuolar iron transporter n=1 Tax=Tagetes erecta TaxID=13708 RepID=A0AAD8KIS7_TARER|nr:hypothetical protein QVD17_18807 [Tagetes erecta]
MPHSQDHYNPNMVHDSPEPLEPCGDHTPDNKQTTRMDRLKRAQWLRAAILGANDGLLSTTSLMMGVGAAHEGQWFMILSGLAGAIAGACSMAVGEFVSVSTQRDIELVVTQEHALNKNLNLQEIKLENSNNDQLVVDHDENERLPNPYKAGAASASAFLCGSLFPLVGAMVINDYATRIVVVVVVASLALALFGGVGAMLGGSGRSSVRASATRVLIGGWVSMAVTYALLKPLDSVTDKRMGEDD